jgi:hypothetical protein
VRPLGVAATVAAAALVLAPSAGAHGSVRPTVAPPGSTQEFAFLVAARGESGMVGFTVDLPPGATLVEAGGREPEWTVSSSDGRVEWRGGPSPGGAVETFTLRATLPDRLGTVDFVGREHYEDGPGPAFRLGVVLAGRASAAAETKDESARTALVIMLAALVLAGAGFFLGLGRRLRGRPTQ